jgi:hypothetical protein
MATTKKASAMDKIESVPDTPCRHKRAVRATGKTKNSSGGRWRPRPEAQDEEQNTKAKVQILDGNQNWEDELKSKNRPDLQTTQRKKRVTQPRSEN